jgi:hypothetical protein
MLRAGLPPVLEALDDAGRLSTDASRLGGGPRRWPSYRTRPDMQQRRPPGRASSTNSLAGGRAARSEPPLTERVDAITATMLQSYGADNQITQRRDGFVAVVTGCSRQHADRPRLRRSDRPNRRQRGDLALVDLT